MARALRLKFLAEFLAEAFWSDRILHKVEAQLSHGLEKPLEASEVVHGIDDYRVSYVIWLWPQGVKARNE